ncbi:MAG: penicillin-binding protein [Candidatus Pacebacteria bacterium]|nr:penicillin-binding protein [Candidatus Paceibacterota bacterium]
MAFTHRAKIIFRNTFFAFAGIFVVIGGIILIWISTINLPDFSSFTNRKEINSTKIYDRTGTVVLYNLGSNVRRTSIPYTEMGANIKNATVAIEDGNFYGNIGIEPKALVRALYRDITGTGVFQGGSTITQQVIKKSLLSDEKTIIRKLKEIVLSLKLDKAYTKDEILGVYLNEIPYGGNIYGIEEASLAFLGKKPADLTIAESAVMASIPNAPTRYSPYGSHKDELDTRKRLVLSRMKLLGFITEDEYKNALSESINFLPPSQGNSLLKAPHFVFFIKDYLEQKYGADTVESGGLKVTTTLNYDLQQSAEKAIALYTTGANKKIEDSNAALVSIDPKTGQILAMVGSRNYFDKKIDGNFNVATAKRQPGSSFKPFMYVTAFEKGFTPETMLFDVPTEFSSSCDPYGRPYGKRPKTDCYMPSNFDETYHGPMSIRSALARSINIPAVKMLYIVGIKNAIKTAQDMGVTTLTDPDNYGLPLVLGGGEVKLLDMVSAYGVFATGGTRHSYSGILTVEDKNGVLLEEWKDSSSIVLPKNPTLEISDILSDNEARTPTFGARSQLFFPEFPDRQIAVKTGTTNNHKDSWTIGYTPSIATGIWIGKNDNTPTPQAVQAAPIWHTYMAEILPSYPAEVFEKPTQREDYEKLPPLFRGYWQGNESFVIDTVSGKLATELTPKETRKEIVLTNVHDILYWISKDDPFSGKPENPSKDSLYNNWETAVRNWWANNSHYYPIVTDSQKPTEFDDVHTIEKMPEIMFSTPTPETVFSINDSIPVSIISTKNTQPIKKIDVFLNGVYVGTSKQWSSSFNFSVNSLPSALHGSNTLMVVATDSIGNTASATMFISISL